MCFGMDCVQKDAVGCPHTKKGAKIVIAGKQELAKIAADGVEVDGWRNVGRKNSSNGLSVVFHPGCPHVIRDKKGK